MDKINNRRRKGEAETNIPHAPSAHSASAKARRVLLRFPAFWSLIFGMHRTRMQHRPSKEKKSLLGEEAKAFGNSWLILDKAGDGVTRFGTQASVFSFKNHLETESHVGVFQEPSRGQKARGVKGKIKHIGRINTHSFTMPDTQTMLGCLCFKVTLPCVLICAQVEEWPL